MSIINEEADATFPADMTDLTESAPITPSDMTQEESDMLALFSHLMQLASKNAPKIAQASDKEWKELNKSEHIVTSGESLQAETKATKFKSDLERLMASSKSGRILTGTIIGIRSTNVDKDIAT